MITLEYLMLYVSANQIFPKDILVMMNFSVPKSTLGNRSDRATSPTERRVLAMPTLVAGGTVDWNKKR